MTANPQPPPEAQLIRQAREAPPKMTLREAAGRAGISEGRWRQIEAGGWLRRGRWESEIAPAQTLAAMARAVGVTPAQLTAAGRQDAAAELAAMPPPPPAVSSLEQVLENNRRLEQRVEELERIVYPEGKDDDNRRNAI